MARRGAVVSRGKGQGALHLCEAVCVCVCVWRACLWTKSQPTAGQRGVGKTAAAARAGGPGPGPPSLPPNLRRAAGPACPAGCVPGGLCHQRGRPRGAGPLLHRPLRSLHPLRLPKPVSWGWSAAPRGGQPGRVAPDVAAWGGAARQRVASLTTHPPALSAAVATSSSTRACPRATRGGLPRAWPRWWTRTPTWSSWSLRSTTSTTQTRRPSSGAPGPAGGRGWLGAELDQGSGVGLGRTASLLGLRAGWPAGRPARQLASQGLGEPLPERPSTPPLTHPTLTPPQPVVRVHAALGAARGQPAGRGPAKPLQLVPGARGRRVQRALLLGARELVQRPGAGDWLLWIMDGCESGLATLLRLRPGRTSSVESGSIIRTRLAGGVAVCSSTHAGHPSACGPLSLHSPRLSPTPLQCSTMMSHP